MARHRTLDKVTAFITRGRGPDAALLVFQHPTAGVQLPAGTAEIGETVEAALWREVAEETGLRDVRLLSSLGTLAYPLPGDRRVVLRATKLFDEPSFDASTTGYHLSRGVVLRYLRPVDTFAEVVFEEHDFGHEPPVLIAAATGYVRHSVLGHAVERHLFHLETTAATPESWHVVTDNHPFRLFWLPLRPRPRLVAGQDEWLATVHERLLAATGPA